MILREAGIADSTTMAQLSTELGYAATAEVMATRLKVIVDHTDHCVLVAKVDGRVVGWIQASVSIALESGFRAEIMGLVVSAQHRRLGIGRHLVDATIAWAVNQGADVVVVRTNVQRAESHQFYPSMGFVMSKTQAVYRKTLNN